MSIDTIDADTVRRTRLGLIPHHSRVNTGRVLVYSLEQQNTIAADASLQTARAAVRCISHNRSKKFAQIPAIDEKQKGRNRQVEKFFQKQGKINDEIVRQSREIMARKTALKEKSFQDMLDYADIGSKPIEDIERYLDAKELEEEERKEQLCKAWNQTVFDAIQSQIDKNLDDHYFRKVVHVRRQLHDQYLKAGKTNGGVFLDIVHQDEYDPFVWFRYDAAYHVNGILDPLKRDLIEIQKEKELNEKVRGPTTNESAPEQIHPCPRLDVRQWGKGKIEATPHGYFSNFMANSAANARFKPRESNIVFDHFHICKDPEIVARDFPAGGKKVKKGVSNLGSVSDLDWLDGEGSSGS